MSTVLVRGGDVGGDEMSLQTRSQEYTSVTTRSPGSDAVLLRFWPWSYVSITLLQTPPMEIGCALAVFGQGDPVHKLRWIV